MEARGSFINNTSPHYSKQLRNLGTGAMVTLFTSLLLIAFLSPFGYMGVTAFKNKDQIVEGSVLPKSPITYNYEGEEFPIYNVPVDGEIKQWALIKKGRETSEFIDPDNAEAGLIEWEGRWRTLTASMELDPQWDNFETAWTEIKFPRLLFNTLFIAVAGMIGTLISSICVAYAFARFPIPGKNFLFLVLVGTIVLPRQVTLVPTYAFFSEINWTGTWLPLIVPHFFANAYNVFLLRQFFRQLPRELDEAAMIDGAGPLRILISVIIPQSFPAIVAVSLFHFVFAWNDYFEPLIYLLGKRDMLPISVGIQQFNFVYDQQPHLIQATAIMGLVLPVVLFFFSQRVFMRGIVVTGVDK